MTSNLPAEPRPPLSKEELTQISRARRDTLWAALLAAVALSVFCWAMNSFVGIQLNDDKKMLGDEAESLSKTVAHFDWALKSLQGTASRAVTAEEYAQIRDELEAVKRRLDRVTAKTGQKPGGE